METEKRKPQKMSSLDIELEIDLLEGKTSPQKTVPANPVSSNKNKGNKESLTKEKKAIEE